jgi:PAS domain S-box-containing protein
VAHWTVTLSDVTESHRRQLHERKRTRLLERIATGEPSEEVLTDILRMLEQEMPGVCGAVLLLRDGGRRLHYHVTSLLPTPFVEATDGMQVGPFAYAFSRAAQHGETAVFSALHENERWGMLDDVMRAYSLQACWTAPIRGSNNEALGLVALFEVIPVEPNDLQREHIREAAHLAGIVIEQDRAATTLRERETRYRLLAENMRDVVALFTPEGDCTWISPSIRDVLGWTPTEVLREGIDVLHPDAADRLRRYRRLVGTTREPLPPIIYRARHKAGHTIWLESLASPVYDADGELQQVHTTSRDVTDRVTQRQALARAKQTAEEASHLKSALLANMSHEIRTPLTSILGFAEVLLDDVQPPNDRFATLIYRSAQRLQHTLESVMQLAKLEADSHVFEPARTDLVMEAQVVVNLFREAAQAAGIHLRFEHAGRALDAVLDPTALHQILRNLLDNAIKFTRVGGHVTVQVRRGRPRV